jgi:3-hydroxybutyryl-CoA dehydrogenase
MSNKKICVCGAGTMGNGIAQVAAQSGFSTILFELNADVLNKAKISIKASLSKLEEKGKLAVGSSESIFNKIIFTSDIADCRADVIIDAIIENLHAKISLFNQLSAINGAQTIYATNTSSLPVTEIAIATKDHTRVAGMHFFNPAPVMKLVEIVAAENTSTEVINELVELSRQFGKTPVVCKDAPGFIVNRVARHYYLEAMKLAAEGAADPETIDKVLEAAGFKMGPFKLMDMIGLDINYSVSNIVWEALGKPLRLTPSPLQKAKVDSGDLGRKTGKGFYQYTK